MEKETEALTVDLKVRWNKKLIFRRDETQWICY